MKNFFNKKKNKGKDITLDSFTTSKTVGNKTTSDLEKFKIPTLDTFADSNNLDTVGFGKTTTSAKDFSSIDDIFKESLKLKDDLLIEEDDRFKWALNLKVLPISILTILCFGGSVFSYLSIENKKAKDTQTSSYLISLNSSLANIEKSSLAMKTSAVRSFNTLKSEKENIDKILFVLKNGGKVKDEIEIDSVEQIEELSQRWAITKNTVEELLKNKENILKSKNLIDLLNEQTANILSNIIRLQSVLLNKESNSEFLIELNSSIYRIISEINNAENKTLSEEDKQYLYVSLSNIKTSLMILKQQYTHSADVISVIDSFESSFSKHLDKNQVVSDISTLNLSGILNKEIIANVQETNIILQEKINEFDKIKNHDNAMLLIYVFTGFLGVLGLVIISFILHARNIKSLKLVEVLKKNQSNEKALLELMGQIQPLDNGDFTKPIFVEDKFLSNISTRIDRTRVQFGNIVKHLKESSDKVLSSASFTEETSQELLNVSNEQFKKIEDSINRISDITNSMDEIAQVAWIAQEESAKSFEESAKGEELVKQSIDKMNEIRLTIQESSKKIKKLGESAQSISEVTGLIKDITKQINILALNAAIQAASSGESGREFTVVAQEVQRLADDSEEATRKIEELINDIQSDTAIAIASMEKTTQEVVIGAQLTEKAGTALKEIHSLSKNTSEQIQEASTKLEEKSSDMATLTIAMQELQQISEESKKSLQDTTKQVEALKDISEELQEIVGRFKV